MILADIDEHWPEVEPGLLRAKEKCGDQTTSLTEIREACRKKQAFLFLVPEGFFILRPQSANGIPEVFVWFVHGRGAGLIKKYLSSIDHLAREIGARRVLFYSARKGYARLKDWEKNGNHYVRSL